MFFADQNRAQLRRVYVEAWRKFSAREPLEPYEAQVAAVVAEHREYVPLLEDGQAAVTADFPPEVGQVNPFLHMSLHLAIREQVATDRPAGIAQAHRALAASLGDAHAAEHAMLSVLGETIWEAQVRGTSPDERAYLERIERLLRAPR
jgi:hypothetical protein